MTVFGESLEQRNNQRTRRQQSSRKLKPSNSYLKSYRVKFPVLSIFQAFSWLLAGAIVLFGFLGSAFAASSYYRGFDPIVFVIVLIPIVIFAGTILIGAELVRLLVRVENHLDAIVQLQHESVRDLVSIANTVDEGNQQR